MIYKISNKGKTVVQVQLIGGEAINVQPGTIGFVEGSKVFKRELDRLENLAGVHAVEYPGLIEEARAQLAKEQKDLAEKLKKSNKEAADVAKKKAEDDVKAAADKKKKDDGAAAAKAKADKEAKEKAERGGNR